MRRSLIGTVATALVVSLVGASGAAGATTVGNGCTGNRSSAEVTILSTANGPGNPFPATVPVSGVITRWTFAVAPIPSGVLTQTLKTFRPAGTPKQFQVVGESAPAPIVSGSNSFETRIAVQAGDYLGTTGVVEGKTLTVYCETPNGGDRVGVIPGSAPLGSSVTVVEEGANFQIPITAIVEPDADNDGFGDETQDKCPQSASTQLECPVIVLDSFPLAKKSSIVVLVAASEPGSVTVSGTAKLPKSSKASSSAKAKLKKVKRNVTAGKIARFTLKFPGNLKAALRSLPRGKSITVKLQASATNVAGQVSKDKAKVKLKGGS